MSAARASVSWRALGTTASLEVTDPLALPAARALLERELEAIDLVASRFRSDSELARVNGAAGRFVPVSALFAEVLAAALRAARVTDGDLDPTVGQALALCGYDRDFAQLAPTVEAAEWPPRSPQVRVERVAGWRVVELRLDSGRVRIPAGVQLDLGATAKAFAADRAAQAVWDELSVSALVNLGGDLAVAGPAPSGGWPVRVTDDHAAPFSAPGQTVSIQSGGIATSSTTVRRWHAGSRQMHHIIDPATSQPAQEVWRTVSVAAASCVDANTASTAAIVRGEAAPTWLAELGLPARLVWGDGVVVLAGAWPEPPPSSAPPRSSTERIEAAA
ncbi:MAG: FAD:protein FMN transferase [Solirubrobacteraceae bacterium]|nr:MAG: thiamine biosynthesis protein [Solirubrobacterales bacterium]